MDSPKDRQEWDFQKLTTYWQDRSSQFWSFLCPFCSSPRRISFQPRPDSFRHFFQVALSSLIFTGMAWRWMNWRGIVSFVPFWMVFEGVYRWRMRTQLPCVNCGFDPYLYLIDVQWARKELESHWRKKFADRGVPFPQRNPKNSS